MAAKEVLLVCALGCCLLYLFTVLGRYPFIVNNEHRLTAGVGCLVCDCIMYAGVFGKGIHINLGLVIVVEVLISHGVVGMSFHPFQ